MRVPLWRFPTFRSRSSQGWKGMPSDNGHFGWQVHLRRALGGLIALEVVHMVIEIRYCESDGGVVRELPSAYVFDRVRG